MDFRRILTGLLLNISVVAMAVAIEPVPKTEIIPPIDQRFKNPDMAEAPSFQRHVVPLFSRLGCNARACHGSFQGQGGFQLSLFGYDFKADHEALFDEESPRVNVSNPKRSLIIEKPTDEDNHEGGLRYELGSWQHNVIKKWIESDTAFEKKDIVKLDRLQITPAEIVFQNAGEKVQLQAVAIWSDGTREDVTPLCRFNSNNDAVVKIDVDGKITGGDSGDSHVVVSYDSAVVPIPVMRAVTNLTGNRYPQVATKTKVDQLVVEKLRKLGIVPSQICTDEEFLRRVSLDLSGTLPTPADVIAFLKDNSPDKRAAKIDELLETPAYAAWWTTKLCDFTGNNDQQLQNTLPQMKNLRSPGSVAWYDWIHKRVAENLPYDQLVEGIVVSNSMQKGDSYREYCESMTEIYTNENKHFSDLDSMPLYWARRDFKQVEPRVINFAYAFMGVRIQCAQCHKHPFDQWSKDDFAQFSGFFADAQLSKIPSGFKTEYDQILKELDLAKSLRGGELRKAMYSKLENGKTIPFSVVHVRKQTQNQSKNKKNKNKEKQNENKVTAKLLGGEVIDLSKVDDARKPLMNWLRDENNPYFAKAFVNRVWAAYFNRGIVHPADDLSLANPPTNAALLDHLAKGFHESGFDMKWVHRTILNSETYQRSWRPNETNAKDETNFSRSVQRRLPAEVIYDAMVQATVSDERASKMLTDVKGRAISIPGAGQNRNGESGYALMVFGRSTRESNCDCDRETDPSLLQTVFMQNDQQVFKVLDGKSGWINQLSQKYNPNKAGSGQQKRRPDNYQKTLEYHQKAIKRARNSGNKKKLAELERNLARFKEKHKSPELKKSPQPSSAEPRDLITQAYLRTLSRFPTEPELVRCEKHLASDGKDPINAIRDIVWALLNTKEFIVNH